jgi:HAD superfamily hydrolase (TIGR01509 family)
MKSEMSRQNRVVLFDLGGVLADLGEPTKTIGLGLTEERFWEIWLNSENVHAFEMGKIKASEFFPRIADEFGQVDDKAFENRLRAWHLPLFPGAETLIRSVPDHCRIALLSNTNAMHWEQVVSTTEIFSAFDYLFLSFETGYYKPAVKSFEQVVAVLDCEPGDVLFLDDSSRNVDAATRFGFEAHQTSGVEAASTVLNSKFGGARNVN